MRELYAVDEVVVTNLVDNVVDTLLANEGPAQRPKPHPPDAERNLCSDHGMAHVVRARRGAQQHTVMFDFGRNPLVLLNNLSLLVEAGAIALDEIDALVLSHGHGDHWGGLPRLLAEHRAALPAALTLHVGEDAFKRRFKRLPDGSLREMGAMQAEVPAQHGVTVQAVTAPTVLGGQALLSGPIARRTAFEQGAPDLLVEGPAGPEQPVPDTMPGEQALIYHLRGKGLVVLTACGHAGVINTVRHAQAVTGVERVHAVMGGFHLSGAADPVQDATVEELVALAPDVLVPMHCTGIPAMEALRQRLPQQVVYNGVGTRYSFAA